MRQPKRWAAGFLVAGCGLALATPAYLAWAAPSLAGYLLHPVVFLAQLVPYAVCAAAWLPKRGPAAPMVALSLAALLFAATAVVYLPMLRDPGTRGGDMIGLAFVAIPAAATAGVVVASLVAWLIMWWRGRTSGQAPV